MKTLGKIFVALLASAAMLVTGAVGASMAMADTPTSGTLTITNTVAGDKFVAYRFFEVESSEGCTAANLAVTQAAPDAAQGDCKIVYKKDIFVDLMRKASSTPENIESASNEEVLEIVNGLIAEEGIDNFVADLLALDAEPSLQETTATGTTVQWTDVAPGYYVIVHTVPTGTDGRNESKAMAATVLAGLETTVELKNDTVTLEKKITNPTDGDAKGSSYNVGDTVNYELTGKLPDNFADYTKFFYYTFTDVLSAGLTPPAASAVTVTIGGTAVTLPEGSVKWEAEGSDGAHKLTVAMGDLKTAKFDGVTITKDSVIKVTYTATVNENAVITNAGNPNTAKVSFTRSPSSTEEGDTTDTPDDKTTVYTFQLTLNKVDNENNPLDGAEFTLYKEDGTTAIGDPVPAAAVLDGETVSSYTANFKGLAAGTYVIKETKTPTGYNTIDDITIKVVATYNADGSIASLSVTDAKGGAIDGFTATVDTGVISSDIVNNPGSMLPSTGGMGTVMLYAIGGLIVFAAAVGLTLMLRKRNA